MGMPASASSTCKPSTLAKLALRLRSLTMDQEPEPGSKAAPFAAVLLEYIVTPPEARTRNWLATVVEIAVLVESAQINAPSWTAWAFWPAAKLKLPLAELLKPPGTVDAMPLAVLDLPPPMAL